MPSASFLLRLLPVFLACLALHPAAAGEPVFSVVYDAKEGKYAEVRTPQLLVTKAGTFLAFAQGRADSHDRSDNDIVLKRSADGGRTWSELQAIAGEGKDSLNSICVVQLRGSGRILVIGCRFPDGYEMRDFKYLSPGMREYQAKAGHDKFPAIQPGYEGPAIARNYLIFSDDDGRTWSRPRDITHEVKRPAPDLSCVPGPGVAVEMQGGPHVGRIVVPCWSRWLETNRKEPGYENRPYAVYSDDGGQSWQRGELTPPGAGPGEKLGDETQLVELPGGVLMLNARSAGRNVAVSQDGGQTWSPLREEKAIPTTPTAAGFIRYSGLGDGAKSRLLFSNPAEPKRFRGVISLSYDEGQSWPLQKVLRPGRFKYSALARLPHGEIACIFDGAAEKGEFPGHSGGVVILARFGLDWLTDGVDGGKP